MSRPRLRRTIGAQFDDGQTPTPWRAISTEIHHLDLTFSDRKDSGGQFGRVEFKRAKWKDKVVAVKYCRSLQRCENELAILSLLQTHEHIVILYGASTTEKPFIVTEFAPLTLEKVIHLYKQTYSYTSEHVLSWSLQIAIALEYIHSKGVFHRRVKPSQMLLFHHGKKLKLTGFEASPEESLDDDAAPSMKNLKYMAPEAIKGMQYTDRCDIFGYGIVLWEMLSRHRRPMPQGSNQYHILFAIVNDPVLPKIIDLPKPISELIAKCSDVNPYVRPSAAEIRKKLEYLCKFVKPGAPLNLYRGLKFLIHPVDVISKPGLGVMFSVKTTPRAKKYEWYFHDTLISSEDGSYEGSLTSILSIPNVLPKHKGVYTCVVTDEFNRTFTSHQGSLKLDGEIMQVDVSKLLGEILKSSNIEFSESGVVTEHLLNGNSDCLTYEEMQCLMKENPTTRILSMNLKEELFSRIREETIYKKAIANGKKVSLSYFKILALGPGQIGKSTFLYRLLGLMKENIDASSPEMLPSCSTGQADLRDVCIKFINMTGLIKSCENWESCELQSQVEGLMRILPEQAEKILAAARVENIPSSASTKQKEHQVPIEPKLSQSTHPTSKTDAEFIVEGISEEESTDTIEEQIQLTRTAVSTPVPSSQLFSRTISSTLVDNTIREYNKLRHKCKHSINVTKLHMLFNIADVGGQPAFLDMLPSLTIGPALYLLFSKLVNDAGEVLSIEDLTTQQIVKYRTRSDDSPQGCLGYTYTLHEVLFSALSSIACFGLSDKEVERYVTKEGEMQKTSSLAVLLGTFADKVQDDQKLKITETDLKALLEKTDFCQRNLICFPNPDSPDYHDHQVFFRINNKTGTLEEIAKYRYLIQRLFEENFRKYDIPTSWLGLGICMKILARNKETYKVSFSDCAKIGKYFNMNEEMVKVALNFLHKYIGLIMYFPNNEHLKDLVICNPQVVFSSVSELTFNVYDATSRKKQHVEVTTQQKRFEKTGIFTPRTVKYITADENITFLSLVDLVNLLVHLNIAAEIKSNDDLKLSFEDKEFFLPSILKVEDNLSQLNSSQESNEELLPEPLCIQFQTGYLPMGFACALSARLIADQKFTLLTIDPILYKNKLKFRFDGRFNVTMISLPLYCEFHVTRHHGNNEFYQQECCPEIRRIINEAADSVVKSMQKTLLSENHFEIVFKCPLCIHKDVKFGHEPLAKVAFTDDPRQGQLTQIRCPECETTISLADYPSMKMWFGESPAIPLEVIKHPILTSTNIIEISAKGTTPLKFRWFLDRQELSDGEDFEGSETCKLIIRKSSPPSEGCYRCRVEDKQGKAIFSDELDLFVEELRRSRVKDSAITKLKAEGVDSMEELRSLTVDELQTIGLTLMEKKSVKKFLSLPIPVEPSASGLTVLEVKKVLNDARSKWFDIGIELDINLETLRVIRSKNQYVVDRCFTEMLSHWLSNCSSAPPTMAAVYRALTSPVIGRQDLAREVKQDTGDCSFQNELTLKEVRRVTWDLRSKWRVLGDGLSIDLGTLDALESTNRFVVGDCFTDMLSHWLSRPSPPTWSEMVDALRAPAIGRDDIAMTIEAKLSKLD